MARNSSGGSEVLMSESGGEKFRSVGGDTVSVEIRETERFAPQGIAHDLEPTRKLPVHPDLASLVRTAKGAVKDRLAGNRIYRAFDECGIVFIHVPKNAGSSIVRALYGDQETGHRTARFVKAIAPDKFERYRVFAAIRNPRKRFVSAFQYLKFSAELEPDIRFRDNHFASIADFPTFMRRFNGDSRFREIMLGWTHFREQTQYICDDAGRLLVDYLVAVERLDDGWAMLEPTLGLSLNIPRKNASPRAVVEDKTDWAIVDDIYTADMRLWERVMQSPVGLAHRAGVMPVKRV